jgi:hypothetical protein
MASLSASASTSSPTTPSFSFTQWWLRSMKVGGVGGAIARYALDDARARGLHVRALCPFIRGWMERHPQYSDLIRPAE